MARLALEEGLRLDVSTDGELGVALAAGAEPDRIVMHGNNKSDAELASVVGLGGARIVVDSFDEIARLTRLAGRGARGAAQQVLVRVNPGIEAHTHEFIATGREDSKFGFSVASGAAEEAIDALSEAGRRRGRRCPRPHRQPDHAARFLRAGRRGPRPVFAADSGLAELWSAAGSESPISPTRRPRRSTEWAAAGACGRAARAGLALGVPVSAEPGRALVGHRRR